MHNNDELANTCEHICCDLISALDEVDAMEKLVSLIEMLHLIDDQERVYTLIDTYLEQHEIHVRRLRGAINSSRRALIACHPKQTSSVVSFFVGAS